MKTKALVAICGSVRAVRALWKPPLSQSAVYQWGEDVPELRALQIEKNHPVLHQKILALTMKKKEPRDGQRRAVA